MMKKVIYIAIMNVLLFSVGATAQTGRIVEQGNDKYATGDYKGAEGDYQKALTKDPKNDRAQFNLGNAYYKQDSIARSRKVMEATAKTVIDKKQKADAYYNIGNTYMKEQKWKEAADAYKQALRNNPQDADAKYNLSYALQKLKQEQQQQQQDKDNKDQKKDEKDKKDKKDDKQDKKDQQNKDQQKEDDQKKEDKKDGGDKGDDKKDKEDQKNGKDNKKDKGDDKKQRQPQAMPSKISKQQADQLLNALQQEEKKLQDKLKQGKAVPVKVEKDW